MIKSPYYLFIVIFFILSGYIVSGAISSKSYGIGKALADSHTRGEFSREERKQLAKGALITRPITKKKKGWKLVGGTSWQVINASPHIVWQALLDTRYYHRILPRVLEVRTVQKNENKQTLFMKQGTKLFNVTYFLNLNIHPRRKDITFSVDQNLPHTLKGGWGFYTVQAYGNEQTILSYGVMADIGNSVVASLVRDSVHEWMLKVPWLVKRFVEGSGRWIYK